MKKGDKNPVTASGSSRRSIAPIRTGAGAICVFSGLIVTKTDKKK